MSAERPKRKKERRTAPQDTKSVLRRYDSLQDKLEKAKTLPEAKGVGKAFSDAAMTLGALIEESHWLKALDETPQVTNVVGHTIWEKKQQLEAGKKPDKAKDKPEKQHDPLESLYTKECTPEEEVAAKLAETETLMKKTDTDEDQLIENFGNKYIDQPELLKDVIKLIGSVRRREHLASDLCWLEAAIENPAVATSTIKEIWRAKDRFSDKKRTATDQENN
jgi:hypothetical protein